MENDTALILFLILLLCAALGLLQVQLNDLRARLKKVEMEIEKLEVENYDLLRRLRPSLYGDAGQVTTDVVGPEADELDRVLRRDEESNDPNS